jgi:hypothetical protein
MTDLCRLIFWTLVDLMRARATLEAEIWVLRQQINVLRRAAPRRQSFGIFDRLIFVGLYRLFPKACGALAIVKPDTIIRRHRAGFKAYWRWKSRRCGGRPTVPLEVRKLIRDMSIANPLWGAPRIHGELLMLGVEIGQTSVAKYMVKRREPPSQGWKTFLRNHADGIAAIDLFVVPTISFRLLYGLLIVGHGRRQILWLGITSHPTAEWIANQITEACGWEQVPRTRQSHVLSRQLDESSATQFLEVCTINTSGSSLRYSQPANWERRAHTDAPEPPRRGGAHPLSHQITNLSVSPKRQFRSETRPVAEWVWI